MTDHDRQPHWQGVYTSKGEAEVSWFQESPAVSLEMIELAGVSPAAAIIDIGGGASRLVDALLDRGFQAVWVLISRRQRWKRRRRGSARAATRSNGSSPT